MLCGSTVVLHIILCKYESCTCKPAVRLMPVLPYTCGFLYGIHKENDVYSLERWPWKVEPDLQWCTALSVVGGVSKLKLAN